MLLNPGILLFLIATSLAFLLFGGLKRFSFIHTKLFLFCLIVAFLYAPIYSQDSGSYLTIYDETPAFSSLLRYHEWNGYSFDGIYGETSYTLVSSIAKSLKLDFVQLKFVLLFFLFYLRFRLFLLLKCNIFYSSLMYFSFLVLPDVTLIRASIASSVLSFSLYYLFKRRLLLSLLILLLASSFHISSFLIYFFCFPLLFAQNPSTSLWFRYSLIFPIGMVLAIFVFMQISDLSFVSIDALQGRIEGYQESAGKGLLRLSVLLSGLMAFIIYHYKPLRHKDFSPYIQYLLFAAFLFLVVFNQAQHFSDRFFGMIAFSLPLAFGFISNIFSKNSRVYLAPSFYIIFFLLCSTFMSRFSISYGFPS